MTQLILYLTISTCGYISTGDKTAKIVTDSETYNNFFRTLMTIGRIGVYIKLAISISCHFYPLKVSLYQVLVDDKGPLKEPGYNK